MITRGPPHICNQLVFIVLREVITDEHVQCGCYIDRLHRRTIALCDATYMLRGCELSGNSMNTAKRRYRHYLLYTL
jgi:hypothetical protein